MSARSLTLAAMCFLGCSSGEIAVESDAEPEAEADADADAEAEAEVAIDTAPTIDRSKCVADADKVGLTTRPVPGKATTYLADVPATYDKTKPTTLVIALHGAGDTASNYLNVVWRAN